MRKYLVATALGAMLMAGQAAAYDTGIVNVGDRIASQAATSDNMQGMDSAAIAALLASGVVMGIFFWALAQGNGNNNGFPATP
jgi:altronate dehydratase